MAGDVDGFFEGRPASRRVFETIAAQLHALGPVEVSVGAQISFGGRRKFCWFWLYNVTKSNPDGVPHVMLALAREVDDDRIRNVSQVGKQRWNHQIVVRSAAEARAGWFGCLLAEAYQYGQG